MGNQQPKEEKKDFDTHVREAIQKHSIEPWHARQVIKEQLELQGNLARRSPLKEVSVEEGLKYFAKHSAATIKKEAFVKICSDLLDEHKVWTTPGDRDELKEIFKALDFDGSGELDRGEWAGGLSVFFKGTQEQCIHAVFAALDKDGSKTLDKKELGEYLKPVVKAMIPKEGAPLKDQLIGAALDKIYSEMDTDQQGGVSADEMVEWSKRGNNLVGRLADIIDKEVYRIWLSHREQSRGKDTGGADQKSTAQAGGQGGPPLDQTQQSTMQSAWQQTGAGPPPGFWQQTGTAPGMPPGQSMPPGAWQQGPPGQSTMPPGAWQQGPPGQSTMPPGAWQQGPPGQSMPPGAWQQGPPGQTMPPGSWQTEPPGQTLPPGTWQQAPPGQSGMTNTWQQGPPGQSPMSSGWQPPQGAPGQSTLPGGWPQGPNGQGPNDWQQQGYSATQGPNAWQQSQMGGPMQPPGPWQQQQMQGPNSQQQGAGEDDHGCGMWSCCGACGCHEEEAPPRSRTQAGTDKTPKQQKPKAGRKGKGARPERDGTVWYGHGWGDSSPEGEEVAAMAAEGRDWHTDLPESWPWNVPPPPPPPARDGPGRQASLDSQGSSIGRGRKAGASSPALSSGTTAAGESYLSSAPYTPCSTLGDMLPDSPRGTGSPHFKSSGAYMPRSFFD